VERRKGMKVHFVSGIRLQKMGYDCQVVLN
jgi:hypothetical protein